MTLRNNARTGPRPANQSTPRDQRNASQTQRSSQSRSVRARNARRRSIWIRTGLSVTAGAVILSVIFLTGGRVTSKPSTAYPYQVGQPGPGSLAPNFTLASNRGGDFSLAAQRGKTVLLFFQEGIDCQPCWTQLQAIQSHMRAFHRAGISEVVSVTTNNVGALKQAAATYGTTIPVLSDPNLAVSKAYHANDFTMMGTSADGHSFIVVGPTGRIRWRADYGGAPDYTMYVPVATLLHQMVAAMARVGRS